MMDGAERENAEWMDCKKERAKRAKRMSNRENKEHRRALRMVCALLSAFVCAFILFAAIVSAYQAESTHQFTLEIYGNANEDDTIDMRDVTYIKLVIFGKKPETEFCDANYDGRVSMLDVVQTKLIIVGKEGEITFVDSEGRAKTIDMPVNSVIPLNSDAAEAIRVVGATHKIVAIDSSISKKTSFFPEISALPTIGRGFNPDIEEILAISPDIVVAYAPGIYNPGHEDLEDKLEPAVKVVRLDSFNRGADKLREEIMILGYILGEVENAKKYVDWYDKYVGAVKDRVSTIPEDDRVKVFIDWCSAGPTSRHTIARGGLSFLCEEAGGINIAAEFEVPYPDVELEWVIRENPDVIVGYAHGRWFKGESGYETDDKSGVRAFLEEIKGLPGFESVSAVKNGRIYIISAEIVTSTAYPVGLSYMAKWFYPELFEDLNPEEIHQEYIDDFCGIDYDVSEHGVFVYWEE